MDVGVGVDVGVDVIVHGVVDVGLEFRGGCKC